MADRVHRPVDAVQPAHLDPVGDRASTKPGGRQLRPAHDAVLGPGQSSDAPIGAARGPFDAVLDPWDAEGVDDSRFAPAPGAIDAFCTWRMKKASSSPMAWPLSTPLDAYRRQVMQNASSTKRHPPPTLPDAYCTQMMQNASSTQTA